MHLIEAASSYILYLFIECAKNHKVTKANKRTKSLGKTLGKRNWRVFLRNVGDKF